MGNIFSLDDYKKQADKEYKSYQIRVKGDKLVTLNNPLRISEKNRERLFEIIPQLSSGEGKTEAKDLARLAPLLIEVLELVGDENVGELIADVRDDLPLTFAIFQAYFEEIGLGEASHSES